MPATSFPRTRTARRGAAAIAAVALLALAGCSDDSASEGGDTPEQRVEVTITGDQVSPMGERVEVKAGAPVTFEITADRAGELHVHSTPEQSLEFEDGTVEREITLDQPGIVEVESHDPDLVLVQLEVR